MEDSENLKIAIILLASAGAFAVTINSLGRHNFSTLTHYMYPIVNIVGFLAAWVSIIIGTYYRGVEGFIEASVGAIGTIFMVNLTGHFFGMDAISSILCFLAAVSGVFFFFK